MRSNLCIIGVKIPFDPNILKLNILFIVGEDANALLNLFVKDY